MMSDNKKSHKTSIIITSICFLLVAILAGGLFGMQYVQLMGERDALESQLTLAQSERDAISVENLENQSKISELNKNNSKLSSTISKLNSDVNQLKRDLYAASSDSLALLNEPNDGKKICYLTFDDGPSENTLKILKVLKKANAKATFFVVGTSKLSYIKKAKEAGHTVALHTNTHDFAKIYKNENAYFNDLEAIHKKVTDIIGEIPLIIRFPGGSSNMVSKKYNKGIMTRLTKKVQQKGYVYVDWNVNSGDADGYNVPVKNILEQIKNESKNKDTLCILMHDTDAKSTTVSALGHIICYLRAKGYRFEALTKESEVFHHNINN